MKNKYIFIVLLLHIGFAAFTQDVKELQETARTFMMQGDYTNAIIVLNRAMQTDPNNLETSKNLALNYYMQGNNDKALETIKPTLDRDDNDDQCFQIAGNIYNALQLPKESDKLYKKGIKKFPESGALYSEYGELLWAQQDNTAIKQWEKGIESDPDYSKNYYNACRYYNMKSENKVWTILYGEIFLNMEPLNTHGPEIKTILLDTYKQLFSDADITKNNKDKNKFVDAFLQSMNRQSSLVITGINAESLTMIRTRFVLDWFYNYADKFPYKLFEQQRQLLQEGLFPAYNQSIFGSAQNLAAYQTWTSTHTSEQSEFTRFQKGRTFKIPANQYYH